MKKRTNGDRANNRDDHMLEDCSDLPRQRFSSTHASPVSAPGARAPGWRAACGCRRRDNSAQQVHADVVRSLGLLGLAEQTLHRRTQPREMILDRIEYPLQIDTEIVMDENVPKPGQCLPIDLFALGLERLAQPLRGLR